VASCGCIHNHFVNARLHDGIAAALLARTTETGSTKVMKIAWLVVGLARKQH
jgi:hypothetical protein